MSRFDIILGKKDTEPECTEKKSEPALSQRGNQTEEVDCHIKVVRAIADREIADEVYTGNLRHFSQAHSTPNENPDFSIALNIREPVTTETFCGKTIELTYVMGGNGGSEHTYKHLLHVSDIAISMDNNSTLITLSGTIKPNDIT